MKKTIKSRHGLLSYITLSVLITQSTAYEVHEWGTFTTVSGSDGVLLEGLHHEEEHLPLFVHALDGMKNRGPFPAKGWFRPLKNVTVKMETPVIYFYSAKPFQAQVKVGFNGGSISQWYPNRSGGEIVNKPSRLVFDFVPLRPPYPSFKDKAFKQNEGIDFAQTRHGSIQWDVDILSPEANRGLVFKPNETMNWIRPRNPKANILRVKNEHEDYLFYRGIGNFPLPVKFTVGKDETLTIHNQSDEKIPFLFVHEITENRQIRFLTIKNGIASHQQTTVSVDDLKTAKNPQRAIYDAMFSGLTSSGLFPEEAHGMIQTWWRSYFIKRGLRVFWILPKNETDQILPLEISPQPQKIVRTLVGRSEILRPSFEEELVSEYKNQKNEQSNYNHHYFTQHFGEPHFRRARTLALDHEKIAE